jgi:prevent-host-death family protein
MTEVGIETLREHLTDYLKLAQEGERIVVTENGRSVALLIPLEGNETVRRAWKLVESGAASWRGGKPSGSRQRPRNRGKLASDMVLEDRR